MGKIFSIPHSRPDLGSDEITAVISVIKSGMLSSGEKVVQFEEAFKRYIGVKYAVAVNSGTSALHLALLSLGIKEGDEVIIPTYVCTALLNAVNYTGAVPVIADVSPDDGNISAETAKKKLSRRTKCIIIPHMFGSPADVKGIKSLGVPVIEDCAQSIGAKLGDKKAGSLGDISIFSFYSTKMMATGEGGMMLANDKKIIEKIADLREYDHQPDYKVRYNYKMTDISAALGIKQLKKIETFIKKRREIAGCYRQSPGFENIIHPEEKKGTKHVFFRYVVKLKNHNVKTTIERFKKSGVNTELPLFLPIHHYLKLNKKEYAGAEKLYQGALSLPIYPALKKNELEKIVHTVKGILRG